MAQKKIIIEYEDYFNILYSIYIMSQRMNMNL